MKIFHIEDSKLVIGLVKEMIKGHEFRSCESFEKFRLSDAKWADLILLDLKLDSSTIELEGIKILDLLEKSGIKKRVVLLTALPMEAKKLKNKYGFIEGVVEKPFLKKDLQKYVEISKK